MANSIAARLAAVDGAAAQAANSRAIYEGLRTQLEVARLAMEADALALKTAKRSVVDGLLDLGHPVYLNGAGGARTLIEVYRGDFRASPLGDGTEPIPIK